MSVVAGPHMRSMQQVKGRRFAAELNKRLEVLHSQMQAIPSREGGAAIAAEEENAAVFESLDALDEERRLLEPFAAGIYRMLRDQRRELISGSGVSSRVDEIRADLGMAIEDHAWGAGDSIETSVRHLDGIAAVVASWRKAAANSSESDPAPPERALKTLKEVDDELVSLVVIADRLHHWRLEKTPLRLLSHVEAVFSHLKLAFLVGLLMGLPWITYEIWLFIAAGLYQHERSVIAPFLPFSLIGLVCGGMFAYHVLIPVGLSYLAGYGDPDLFEPNFTLSNYMSLIFTLLIGMGLVFQLPLLMIFLSRSGIVSPEQFRKVRKYSILGALVVGAFLTPPDVVTQLLMAGPLVILYETGILASVWFRRRARAREAELAATGTAPDDAGGKGESKRGE